MLLYGCSDYLGHKGRPLTTTPAQSVEFREPEWIACMDTVLEVLNEGIVIADDRPHILFADSRFVEMIGIPAAPRGA